ncbi:MAG TPA: ammonia-forming cytochrome c nitrite reductase subunit c552 [Terriglobales bacterium]|nr:ammonia-forming cytochrome c nitrite reductase subunit c552 [Terriglobales bacterium]
MPNRATLFLLLALPFAASAQTYVGSAACATCHAQVHKTFVESRHSKMVQPATPQGVIGDFSRGTVRLRGSDFTLRKTASGYYITESYLTGKPWKHKILYTLGNRRMQHYLTKLPDGRIVLLPPTWDNVRKQWFHNLEIDDPEEAPGVQVQLWNKSCYSCHVSREEKNFDFDKITYNTKWQDFGINCERCHGPGSDHVADYSIPTPFPGGPPKDIVNPARLDPVRSTQVCAQCHSFRDMWVDNFKAGDNYYDHFLPILDSGLPADDEDPAYWADGRTRRFSNDAFGLWQSECFLKGKATCITCHVTPHNTNVDVNPQLETNGICLQCHSAIGKDIAAHTHHLVASQGSSCVECHMPRTVLSIKAQIRDHSMSIPVPENTINHGIPNACNNCHTDKTPQWAVAAMNNWWGSKSRQKLIARADAFDAAKHGDASSVDKLIALLSDPANGSLVRGNAAGYLGKFAQDPRAFLALSSALTDSDPLVRIMGAREIQPGASNPATVAKELVPLLRDPVAIVRATAAVALVGLGVQKLPGEDGLKFEQAKEIYYQRAHLDGDDAGQQVAAGKFYFLEGKYDRAADAFRESMRIDPAMPAQYYLAMSLAQQGQLDKASAILASISRNDPQYKAAQQLLSQIKKKGGKFVVR